MPFFIHFFDPVVFYDVRAAVGARSPRVFAPCVRRAFGKTARRYQATFSPLTRMKKDRA